MQTITNELIGPTGPAGATGATGPAGAPSATAPSITASGGSLTQSTFVMVTPKNICINGVVFSGSGLWASTYTNSQPNVTQINGTMTTSLTFNNIDGIDGDLDMTVYSCPALNLGQLKHINGNFNFTGDALTTLTANSLEAIVGNIDFHGISTLTTVSMSALKGVGSGAPTINFNACALNQASVDHVLVIAAAMDGTGVKSEFIGSVDLGAGTNSAPSATGLAAKATLEARGCTVTVNP